RGYNNCGYYDSCCDPCYNPCPKPEPRCQNFSDFYQLSDVGVTPTIVPGADVEFPSNGPTNGVIVRTSTTQFLLPTIGSYEINFQCNAIGGDAATLVVTLNGVELPQTHAVVSLASGQIVGMCIINTTAVNTILTIRNPALSPYNISMDTVLTSMPSSSHLVIKELANWTFPEFIKNRHYNS